MLDAYTRWVSSRWPRTARRGSLAHERLSRLAGPPDGPPLDDRRSGEFLLDDPRFGDSRLWESAADHPADAQAGSEPEPFGEPSEEADLGPAPPGRRTRRPERSARGARRIALPALAVGGVAAALAAVAFVATRPEPEWAPALPPAASSSTAAPVSTTPGLVVSVVGAVRRPGLVTTAPGARVADVIRAAGGARRGTDLTTVNLARKVVDGEQIHVGAPGAAGAAGPGVPPGAQPEPVIDLNTATQDQLESLPGIGAVTAGRILEWRARHGAFTSVEQLREVDGIGERRFADLRGRVAVG